MSNHCIKITLLDLIPSPVALGSKLGLQLLERLRSLVSEYPNNIVFQIDFSGIQIMDATCARESLVALALLERGKKGFYLSNISNADIIFNIACASTAKKQPFLIKHNTDYQWIGKDLTSSAKNLLNLVYNKREMNSSTLSKELMISLPNASAKLRKLYDDGFVLGNKVVSPTGGNEYIYLPFLVL